MNKVAFFFLLLIILFSLGNLNFAVRNEVVTQES